MGLFEFERYFIAHDALMFLTFIPCVIIFFCSLCLARRRHDTARTAFTYLKLALACLSVAIFLDICAYGLAIASTRLEYGGGYYYDASVLRTISLAQASAFAVAQLFESITDILVFLILLRLSTGILIVQSGNPAKGDKILKLASYGIAALLAILVIAKFGLRIHFNAVINDDDVNLSDSDINKLEDQFNSSRQIEFAFHVLTLVLAVAIVARSIMVKMQTRTEPRLGLSSNILIACAGLWLLRTVYAVAAMAASINLKDARNDPSYKNYFDITDVIFGIWPLFILLCLVFSLGRKRRNGLWSTEQPFMMVNPGGQQPSWGNGYNVAQNVAPPIPQQQQQNWVQNAPPQQQQSTYFVPPNQYAAPTQYQTYPQYAPQQQQPQGQPPLQQQNLQSPVSQTRSPPPHEDAMGLNHQADGTPPQTTPQTYYEKA
ncbi:hypothetical protein AK830_g6952 [Neonectria ditissima]|uniref:Uncharacterized protein n=1 Tax=Neonectria ditissima TaxID=78410 RepID=A0A0P7BF59_9HYPO|nr:hypothetical protein AK830_g6952 [Neonectria ditissima]